MRFLSFSFEDLLISRRDIYDEMGYNGREPDQRIIGLVDSVLEVAAQESEPSCLFNMESASRSSDGEILVSDINFRVGKIISSYLEGMNHACFFIATAGCKYDRYIKRLHETGDIVGEFIADAVGSAIVEAVVERMRDMVVLQSDEKCSLPYSPGYCGWNIADQKKLFSLFPPDPCGVSLSESCLMTPIKSISGFLALGKDLKPQPYNCEICQNKKCYKRKTK